MTSNYKNELQQRRPAVIRHDQLGVSKLLEHRGNPPSSTSTRRRILLLSADMWKEYRTYLGCTYLNSSTPTQQASKRESEPEAALPPTPPFLAISNTEVDILEHWTHQEARHIRERSASALTLINGLVTGGANPRASSLYKGIAVEWGIVEKRTEVNFAQEVLVDILTLSMKEHDLVSPTDLLDDPAGRVLRCHQLLKLAGTIQRRYPADDVSIVLYENTTLLPSQIEEATADSSLGMSALDIKVEMVQSWQQFTRIAVLSSKAPQGKAPTLLTFDVGNVQTGSSFAASGLSPDTNAFNKVERNRAKDDETKGKGGKAGEPLILDHYLTAMNEIRSRHPSAGLKLVIMNEVRRELQKGIEEKPQILSRRATDLIEDALANRNYSFTFGKAVEIEKGGYSSRITGDPAIRLQQRELLQQQGVKTVFLTGDRAFGLKQLMSGNRVLLVGTEAFGSWSVAKDVETAKGQLELAFKLPIV